MFFVSVSINILTANSLFSNPEYDNDGVFGRNDLFGQISVKRSFSTSNLTLRKCQPLVTE